MVHGFMYLVAVLDWYSRRVLSWELSNTMDVAFCIAALEAALGRYGAPDIFNTDQGSQDISEAFTGVLQSHQVAICMDGRGRFLDNIFIERLWRSVKYEDIYLRAYDTPLAFHAGLRNYFGYLQRPAAACLAARVKDPGRGVFRRGPESGGRLMMTPRRRSPLAEPPGTGWRRTQGPRPFFLLPAMNLLPARPRRRRHPEGRSGGGAKRLAFVAGDGLDSPSRWKQENDPATAQRQPWTPQIAPFQSRPSRSKLLLVPLSRNWGPPSF